MSTEEDERIFEEEVAEDLAFERGLVVKELVAIVATVAVIILNRLMA